MTNFITRVRIPEPAFKIDYQSDVLLMGSCFTENIGKRLKLLKFSVTHNPFGVVYNPISLSDQINLLLNKESFNKEDLNFFNELWFSYSHYTLFSDPVRDKCLEKINQSFNQGKKFIRSAKVIFLTLGTSYVYTNIETGKVVANCHKIPARNFKRYFSSVGNTVRHLKTAINEIRRINPKVHFVITVSPIRHWKDGAIENQRSKAALLLSISQLQEAYDDIYYFPVYEFFMDELRDYRYYADDMLHPSSLAINLVWERFSEIFLSSESKSIANEVQKIITGLEHRPNQVKTKAYKAFLSDLQKKISTVAKAYPFLDFSGEETSLKSLFNKN